RRHPWVERRVDDVCEQVDQDDEEGEDEGRPLDDRIVARRHRVDEQPADSGDGEDVLDQDRAADQEREVDSEDDDERRNRIAEDVTPEYGEPTDPLDPRRVDEVTRKHRQRARAERPDEDRRERKRKRERREEQVLQVADEARAVAVDGEKRNVDREDQDQDDPEPERGHSEGEQEPDARDL